MFIVIEGIHNVGKSTLLAALDNIHQFYKFKSRRSIPSLKDNSTNIDISQFALGVNCTVVWFSQYTRLDVAFDRLHLSEFAYSQVMRNMDSAIAIDTFVAVDYELAKNNVRLIYLDNDLLTILERTKERNKYYNEDQTKRVMSLLDEAYELSRMKKIKLHTNEDVMILAKKVIDFLELGGNNENIE